MQTQLERLKQKYDWNKTISFWVIAIFIAYLSLISNKHEYFTWSGLIVVVVSMAISINKTKKNYVDLLNHLDIEEENKNANVKKKTAKI